MRVIAIGGYPGVGKSTLVRKLISKLEEPAPNKMFTMDFLGFLQSSLVIMGSYEEGELFPGTDRFSMAVQPNWEKFLMSQKDSHYTILFEGDRLFNGKTIKFLWENKIQYRVCFVTALKHVIDERNVSRSKQDPSWRKGRQTKVDNIWKQIPTDKKQFLFNDDEKSSNESVEKLIELIGDPKWT